MYAAIPPFHHSCWYCITRAQPSGVQSCCAMRCSPRRCLHAASFLQHYHMRFRTQNNANIYLYRWHFQLIYFPDLLKSFDPYNYRCFASWTRAFVLVCYCGKTVAGPDIVHILCLESKKYSYSCVGSACVHAACSATSFPGPDRFCPINLPAACGRHDSIHLPASAFPQDHGSDATVGGEHIQAPAGQAP